ncbi:Uma2 family endonuclease [Nostoc sp. CENA67]|uniref:Uma2 family endonuclease n=1 Tax=Amazonocrinis nigriterrae CENA67 TaxID=2794033 RepID=A0A8J7HZY8_9NOST|nr:Uma2 family endonuclease [Amazonocrinis nigriterrae]MBH8565464.1 Uma2 family endonuclease [Amazonocrinis nigriterrae CENA67]
MLSPDLKNALPSTDELPCSDDTPVDNEDQNLLPNVLLFLLNSIWANRIDWFFAVDMAVYHTTGVNPRVPVVPDAFLSVGVERKKGGKSRKSYAVWEENDVVPILTLEMVSHTPGGEYDEKMAIYAKLGVLYYVIYNPEYWRRDQHQPFEVYKLVNGSYQLQIGEPYWMSEVGLGIGRYQGIVAGIQQELLAWYNQQGDRYLMPEEQAQQERTRAEQLAQYLRSLGIDPDNLPSDQG